MHVRFRMASSSVRPIFPGLVALALAAVACAPAAPPSPTVAPARPAPTAAPARQEAKPAPTAVPARPAPTQPAATKAAETPAAKPAARAVEDFYKGKTVRIIVGFGPGGGYDTYARVIARHLGKHIPGNPNVIVENMAGAGSLKAANQVYKVEPKDGTVLGHFVGGLFIQQALGMEGIEFDALKYQIVGIAASDTNICASTARSGLKTLADSMNPGGKQFIVGGNAPGSPLWDTPMILKAALDLNLKMVEGYDGTAKIRLAMEQGEVDGICGWGYESLRATAWDQVQSGAYVVTVQVTEAPIKDMEKAPLAIQLARTDEARQLIRQGIMTPQKVARPFVAAPEVPAERIQALRQAFDETLKDKEFLQDAEKGKLDLAPVPALEAQTMIRDLFAMPASVKTRLKQISENKP